jgi:AraC-like DNA-binding protein
MPQLSLRSYGTEIACHTHDFDQIVLPRHGCLTMDIAGQGGAVSRDQGAFIAAGTAHEYQAGPGDQFFVLDLVGDTGIADDLAADELSHAPFFHLSAAQHHLLACLDHLAPAQLLPDLRAAPKGEPTRWQRLGESWSLLMLEAIVQGNDPAAMARSPGAAPPALRRALDLMQDAYQEKLTVAAIGRAAGLSETRLFLLFRQYLGCSPHDYLTELRLQAAEHMLAHSDLPIIEIAWRSGHGDQAALTRQMRRRRNVTPAAYRRAARS